MDSRSSDAKSLIGGGRWRMPSCRNGPRSSICEANTANQRAANSQPTSNEPAPFPIRLSPLAFLRSHLSPSLARFLLLFSVWTLFPLARLSMFPPLSFPPLHFRPAVALPSCHFLSPFPPAPAFLPHSLSLHRHRPSLFATLLSPPPSPLFLSLSSTPLSPSPASLHTLPLSLW